MNQVMDVLYIEDDPTLAQLVKRKLARYGYQVEAADNGELGLSLLQKKKFDLLIVDYQLPTISGLEILERLAKFNTEIPAIMVSGQDCISVAVDAMKLNCRDYVVKDGQSYLALLPMSVESVLARKKLESEKRQFEHETLKAQASLARAQALAKIGNWEWRQGEAYSWWSQQEYVVFGLSPDDYPEGINFETYLSFIYPEDIDVIKSIEDKQFIVDTQSFEYRIVHPDGSIRWLHEIMGAEKDLYGNILRRFGTTQDITERKEAEKQLLLAQSVFETASEAIMVTDAEHRIVSVNPAFSRVTGYPKQEVIGRTPELLKSGKHDKEFYKKILTDLEQKGEWSGEVWSRNKGGGLYLEKISVSSIKNAQGKIEQFVSIFSDATQDKMATKEIEYKANYDALTNLPNRNLFNDRLNTALKTAAREQTKVALLFLDLDNFKLINDTYGHLVGDDLLKQVGQRLKANLREHDSVSRLGGDEFTIILADLHDGLDAEMVAEKILSEVAQAYNINEQIIETSTSIGISVYPDDASTMEELYKNADSAMYAAKKGGRNKLSFFTQKMQEQAQQRLLLVNELKLAILEQQFELYFQPIISRETGELEGIDTSFVWLHPVRGEVESDSFIALAEESCLICDIYKVVISKVLLQSSLWQIAGHKLYLALEYSNSHCHSPEMLDEVRKSIEQKSIQPEFLVLELNEKVVNEGDAQYLNLLNEAHNMGINLSFTKFGRGYSSLNHLQALPFKQLKIDSSLINQLSDTKKAKMIEGIILMAHAMGLSVVAEGVDTQEQQQHLVSLNCDAMQGDYFSKPLSKSDFERRYF